jgi:DNA-directed RNA polymerase subunit RPC12/RpoP
MTIDLQTLKCGECGSSVLKRTGLNEYTCEHCGSVTLVEDNVSDRLERVLDQVKNEAGRQLAAEQALQAEADAAQGRHRRGHRLVRGAGAGGAAFLQVARRIERAPDGQRPVVAAAGRPHHSHRRLKLGEPRQVLVGSGSSAQPKLLVVARNETGKPLSRAGIRAVYYDGDSKLDERSETLPIAVLEPGESAPALIDMPSGKNVTRQELRVQKLSRALQRGRRARAWPSRACGWCSRASACGWWAAWRTSARTPPPSAASRCWSRCTTTRAR